MRNYTIPIAASLMLISGITLATAAQNAPSVLTIEKEAGKPIATFTVEELGKAFPSKTLETVTPWTNGEKRRYRGAPLKDILAKYGSADAATVTGVALDGFEAKLETKEIKAFDPIVATEVDCVDADRLAATCTKDQEFRVLTDADRGPFYVVWPYEQLPKSTNTDENYRWIWFLAALRP
ncbi:hypothetical protein [Phyllobacterium sp. P30BS-XVII]|uniref:hypothetical protein n=1 Tax=Phyllobacterium sp. P30BS-XVII TaxID=2587046 RepID=UPI000DDB288E|nr:hypothetical protein [Phyllobacterium sp. P30BS-XVII]MBA8902964.1 hypothetical protein [Phyllobacterium sp. P30BS-XVII]